MWRWPIAIACILTVGVIVVRSRNRSANAPTIADAPQSESVAVRSSSIQVTVQPSCIVIDGKRIDFPPAKLRVEKIDDKVVAVLSSAKSADKSAQNAGNSFYLQMPLEAEEA